MKITLTNDQIVKAFAGYEAASKTKVGGELAFDFAFIGAALRSANKIVQEAEETIAGLYGETPKDDKGNEMPGIAIPPIKQRAWGVERDALLAKPHEIEFPSMLPKSAMVNPKYEWPAGAIESLFPFIDKDK